MTNGDIKLEMILSSLRVILERDPKRGVDKVSDLLKEASDSEAEKLLRLIQEDQGTYDLYLNGLKQNKIVRKCSWHPQYNEGKNATIVNGRNIPVIVPNGYFDDITEKITYGACSECYSKVLKDEGMK